MNNISASSLGYTYPPPEMYLGPMTADVASVDVEAVPLNPTDGDNANNDSHFSVEADSKEESDLGFANPLFSFSVKPSRALKNFNDDIYSYEASAKDEVELNTDDPDVALFRSKLSILGSFTSLMKKTMLCSVSSITKENFKYKIQYINENDDEVPLALDTDTHYFTVTTIGQFDFTEIFSMLQNFQFNSASAPVTISGNVSDRLQYEIKRSILSSWLSTSLKVENQNPQLASASVENFWKFFADNEANQKMEISALKTRMDKSQAEICTTVQKKFPDLKKVTKKLCAAQDNASDKDVLKVKKIFQKKLNLFWKDPENAKLENLFSTYEKLFLNVRSIEIYKAALKNKPTPIMMPAANAVVAVAAS